MESGSIEMEGDGDMIEHVVGAEIEVGGCSLSSAACVGPEGDYSTTLSTSSTEYSGSSFSTTTTTTLSCSCSYSRSSSLATTTSSGIASSYSYKSSTFSASTASSFVSDTPLHPSLAQVHEQRLSSTAAFVKFVPSNPAGPPLQGKPVLGFAKITGSALAVEILKAGKGAAGLPLLFHSFQMDDHRWLIVTERAVQSLDGVPPLDAYLVATFLADVADGLDFLHARGLAHRRLYPRHVLLSAHGSAFLHGLSGLAPESAPWRPPAAGSADAAFHGPEPVAGTRAGDILSAGTLGRRILDWDRAPHWIRQVLVAAEGVAWSRLSALRLADALRDGLHGRHRPLHLPLQLHRPATAVRESLRFEPS